MRQSDYAPGGRPVTGRTLLKWLCALFGTMLVANGALTFFALSNFRGTLVDSGYVASQHFDEMTAAGKAQAARGWTVTVSAPLGRPEIRFAGPDGAALAGLSVAAVALRPLDERDDASLTLTETAPGVWSAAERLGPGQWAVAFTAEGAGEPYRASRRVVVEPGAGGGASD